MQLCRIMGPAASIRQATPSYSSSTGQLRWDDPHIACRGRVSLLLLSRRRCSLLLCAMRRTLRCLPPSLRGGCQRPHSQTAPKRWREGGPREFAAASASDSVSSRPIFEAHGGRLWASANMPRDAVFQFTLSIQKREARTVNTCRLARSERLITLIPKYSRLECLPCSMFRAGTAARSLRVPVLKVGCRRAACQRKP